MTLLVVALLTVGLLAACGDDDSPESTEDAGATTTAADDATEPADDEDETDGEDDADGGDDEAPAGSDQGHCTVRTTGDVEVEFEGPGGNSAVGSDHWLTEEEKLAAAEFLDMDEDEVRRKMEAGEPVFYTVLLNCVQDDDNTLSLLPSQATTLEDFPQAPGTYTIAAENRDEPGVFSILGVIDGVLFSPAGDGTLEITAFDDEHIAGTFTFSAVESFPESGEPRTFDVDGEFDFACTGQSC